MLSEYDRGSNYLGGVVSVGVMRGRHNFSRWHTRIWASAITSFMVSWTLRLRRTATFGPARTIPWANNAALFLEDQFKATSWLTFNGGTSPEPLRWTD